MDTVATGAFLFSRLPVGSYEMRVEKAGFGTYAQSGIRLTVDQMATQNVTLTVGHSRARLYHWTVNGANAILALRCSHLNGGFEDYWEGRRAA